MSVVVTERPRRGPLAAFLIVVVVVLAAIGGWLWYGSRPRPARVVQRDIVGYVTLNGSVVTPPSGRADLYAPFQAPVEKVESSIGKQVARGDVIVSLSVPSVQSTVEQAHRYLQAAETAYANAERTYGAAAGAGAQNPMGQADLTMQMMPYRQQLDNAREWYAQAKAGARAVMLRAPIQGTILALNATPGQTVGTDQKTPVVTIVNLDKLQVEAEMSPQQAAYVKPDMPVVLTFGEVPGRKFEGQVSRITSRVDARVGGLVKEQRYVALVSFRNADDQAKPGMTPAVAIKTGEARDALAVPADAIQQDRGGQAMVTVMRDGKWQQVAVVPGLSDGRYTQVKSGLRSGEAIQITPNPLSAANLPLPGR